MAFAFAPAEPDDLHGAVDLLRPSYLAVAEYLTEQARGGVWKDLASGALLCGHRPEVGPSAFEVTLFPPLRSDQIDRYERHARRPLPMSLRHLYLHANGGFFGDLAVYGIGALHDRQSRSPLDLGMGEAWRASYAPCDASAELFGSRNVGAAGQIGYFMAVDGKVFGRGNEKSNAPADSGQWASLSLWFQGQLQAQG